MTEVSGPGATGVEDGGGQGGFRGLPQNMRKMYRQGQAGAEGRREQRTPGHGESAAGTDWSDLGNAEGERKKQGRNRTNEGEVRDGDQGGPWRGFGFYSEMGSQWRVLSKEAT